jgi:hypothetical protein
MFLLHLLLLWFQRRFLLQLKILHHLLLYLNQKLLLDFLVKDLLEEYFLFHYLHLLILLDFLLQMFHHLLHHPLM